MNRLRRGGGLTIAFLLIAALAVAVSSYLLIRQAWLTDSLRRAEADAHFQLTLAADLRQVDAEAIDNLLETFIRVNRGVVPPDPLHYCLTSVASEPIIYLT